MFRKISSGIAVQNVAMASLERVGDLRQRCLGVWYSGQLSGGPALGERASRDERLRRGVGKGKKRLCQLHELCELINQTRSYAISPPQVHVMRKQEKANRLANHRHNGVYVRR